MSESILKVTVIVLFKYSQDCRRITPTLSDYDISMSLKSHAISAEDTKLRRWGLIFLKSRRSICP